MIHPGEARESLVRYRDKDQKENTKTIFSIHLCLFCLTPSPLAVRPETGLCGRSRRSPFETARRRQGRGARPHSRGTLGGLMDLTGEPDGEPQKPGVAVADIFTGLYAVIAIQAALRRREITGRGAEIDMALFDTQLAVLANQAMNYFVSGDPPRRMGNT